MDISEQVKLKFHGVDFPVVNVNSERHYSQEEGGKIDIEIIPKVFYPTGVPDHFKIMQEVSLNCDKFFSIFILAVGSFEIRLNLDEEAKKHFVNVNAPAIMFPYVRSFISTLTANLGTVTGTLTIPSQFFKGELEEIIDPIEE